MVIEDNNKISLKQSRKMLVFDLFSIPGLIVPYLAANTAGRDGILTIIIGTVFAILYAIIILRLSSCIQGGFIEYSQRSVGKILTAFFYLFYLVKLFATLVFSVAFMGSIIRDTFLVDTNFNIIIAILLLTCSYTAFRGVEVRARVIEFLYYIVLVPIIILLLLGIKGIDINNLAPIITSSGTNIIAGSYYVLLAYSAIDLFIIIPAFLCKPTKAKIKFNWSIGFIGLFNLLLFCVTVGNLGVVGTTKKLWATVTVMQMIKMPGGMIKRQDGIMLSLWLLAAFTFISMLIFYLSYLTNKVLGRKDYQYFILPFVVIAFLVTLIKIDITTLFEYYGKYMAYIGFPQSILIPVIIVSIGKLRKIKGVEEEKEDE
ncbi:GerAB/ArcD/ProY family transporter [Anaeromicropila herbilytica]|uniref:Germination protein n=1 Tax=Anaeromicropila herbilytica TaxID=2785025 RepID=A0A7R7EHH0_9FIRM|nr:endospore germination permease [Anaeromicropila herbilytica]BCN28813.1 germination protein [Anaeromicropila herbilytica]